MKFIITLGLIFSIAKADRFINILPYTSVNANAPFKLKIGIDSYSCFLNTPCVCDAENPCTASLLYHGIRYGSIPYQGNAGDTVTLEFLSARDKDFNDTVEIILMDGKNSAERGRLPVVVKAEYTAIRFKEGASAYWVSKQWYVNGRAKK